MLRFSFRKQESMFWLLPVKFISNAAWMTSETGKHKSHIQGGFRSLSLFLSLVSISTHSSISNVSINVEEMWSDLDLGGRPADLICVIL